MLLEVLHQADDVAEAQDALGEAVGAELLELVELLALAQELHRLAGHGLDGQRRAAACVAVELGEDEAVEVQATVELRRGAHRVLADHRVDDEQDVLGLDRLLDLLELVHERVVDGEAAGGVDDHHVTAHVAGLGDSQLGELHRLHALDAEHRHTELAAEHHELVDRRRTVDVRGHEHGLLALGEQALGQLARGGRLAGALQADHHDDGGIVVELQAGVDRAHELAEFVVAGLDEVVLGRDGHAVRALERDDVAERAHLDLGQEVLGDAELHVGLDEAGAHFAQGLADVVFGELALALQLEAGVLEATRKHVEHKESPGAAADGLGRGGPSTTTLGPVTSGRQASHADPATLTGNPITSSYAPTAPAATALPPPR